MSIITRRNFLKAGGIVAAAAAGFGLWTLSSNGRSSEKFEDSALVKKLSDLKLPVGFEKSGRVVSQYPLALAGQGKDYASFFLIEKGERKIFGRGKEQDKLGLYVVSNGDIKRLGEYPVLPGRISGQGYSAIGAGDLRYSCFNLFSGNQVEVRKTFLNKKSDEIKAPLVYRGKPQINTTIEAVSPGNGFLLENHSLGEFLLIPEKKDTIVGYNSAVKIPIPTEGEQWDNLQGYVGKYVPENLKRIAEEVVSDYIAREQLRIRVAKEFGKLQGKDYSNVDFSCRGFGEVYGSGNKRYRDLFGKVMVGTDNYVLVKKRLEVKDGGKDE